MKREMAAAVLLMAAGGAMAQTSSKAAATAYEALLGCMAATADRLDDNQSDARTIAIALAMECRDEQKKLIGLRRNLDADHPTVTAAIDGPELKTWWLDRATVVALERRSERRRVKP